MTLDELKTIASKCNIATSRVYWINTFRPEIVKAMIDEILASRELMKIAVVEPQATNKIEYGYINARENLDAFLKDLE